jgi:GNAT superfamily N-acetyltransferase
LAWNWRRQELVCDQRDPWEHGIVYRASRFESHFSLNTVRVCDDPSLSVQELIEVADQGLAGLTHRHIAFDSALVAEPLRAGFAAHGFKATRLVLMRYESRRPGRPELRVSEVADDALDDLRVAWQQEDLPGKDASQDHAQACEIRLALGSRSLAVYDNSRPIAFATLSLGEGEIEIGALYVLPEHRSQGLGTALTHAAITTAGNVDHLWITADDEDRPKQLYTRLGFRPVLTTTEFLRLP